MSLNKNRNFAILASFFACSLLLSPAAMLFPGASALAGKDANTVEPAVEHFHKGMAEMKKMDWDRAIDEFLQATEFARNHYHPPGWYWLGVCYKIKLQDAKAIQAFKTHIEQNVGGAPDAHVELGEVYMRNDRDSEAEHEFTTALGEYQGPAPRAHNERPLWRRGLALPPGPGQSALDLYGSLDEPGRKRHETRGLGRGNSAVRRNAGARQNFDRR
jgi:tetratricopeptide (TPR) repeat protein